MRYLKILAFFVVAGLVALVFGPREPFDQSQTFDASALGDDLDAYLAAEEAETPNLRPGTGREIVWASAPGARSEYVIVNIHGFSASKGEIRPVPERVASAFKANLFHARLSGHGQSGADLANATATDWWRDGSEAMAIARRLGEKIILVGTSTGATLATLILADEELSKGVVGLVGVAPNYRFRGAPMWLMRMPFARTILPLVGGAERSWEPLNEEQARWWTHRYPTEATLPMAALVNAAGAVDVSKISQPALFLFNDGDEVVDHTRTREVASQWGGGAGIVTLTPAPGEEPSLHVVTGDVVAPSTTDEAVAAITGWASGL